MPYASTSAVDVIDGAELEGARLSRINMTMIPLERVLRGAGRALRYRLAGAGCGEVARGRVRGLFLQRKPLSKVCYSLLIKGG